MKIILVLCLLLMLGSAQVSGVSDVGVLHIPDEQVIVSFSQNYWDNWTWIQSYNNQTSIDTQIIRTVSRQKNHSNSRSLGGGIDIVYAKVTIGWEVAEGNVGIETITATYPCPAYTNTIFKFGNLMYSAYGTIATYRGHEILSTVNHSITYSVRGQHFAGPIN